MAIFGDPERCIEKIKKYEAVGVSHLLVMFDWGGFPQQTVFHDMELFAKYIMPHFPRSEQPIVVHTFSGPQVVRSSDL
jgi:alkanesulfonate monooxygenase SsuD/methylene tetrahydromethanopterin reductase-like flavin-dependent oxidoreductase (luciferase family)